MEFIRQRQLELGKQFEERSAQSYQNSGANQAAAQQRAQSSQHSDQAAQSRSSGSSDVDREFQNRSRGESQSQRFEEASRAEADSVAVSVEAVLVAGEVAEVGDAKA